MAMGMMTLWGRDRVSLELGERERLSGSASSSGSRCQADGRGQDAKWAARYCWGDCPVQRRKARVKEADSE